MRPLPSLPRLGVRARDSVPAPPLRCPQARVDGILDRARLAAVVEGLSK